MTRQKNECLVFVIRVVLLYIHVYNVFCLSGQLHGKGQTCQRCSIGRAGAPCAKMMGLDVFVQDTYSLGPFATCMPSTTRSTLTVYTVTNSAKIIFKKQAML